MSKEADRAMRLQNAMPPYMTVEQAADLLQVSVATVRGRITERKLKAYRVGKGPRSSIRIMEEDIRMMLTRFPAV